MIFELLWRRWQGVGLVLPLRQPKLTLRTTENLSYTFEPVDYLVGNRASLLLRGNDETT